jgi:hypothetical protein
MANVFEEVDEANGSQQPQRQRRPQLGPQSWGDLPEDQRRMELMRKKYGKDAERRTKDTADRIRRAQQENRASTTRWFEKRNRPVNQEVVEDNAKQEVDAGWASELGVQVPDYRLQMKHGDRAYPKRDAPDTPDTLSLEGQVGRWYDAAGGIAGAVKSATRAQRVNDANSLLDRDLWPHITPEAIARQFPVKYGVPHKAGTHGTFNWGDNTIRTASEKPASYILDHEMTHAATAADGVGGKVRAAGTNPEKSWNPPTSEDRQAYIADPVEVDARLADVKRRYAHYTGKVVDTPEEAIEAWEWWRENQADIVPSEGAGASMGIGDFEFYDKMPDQQRTQLFLRMPELVKSEDRIRDLRRA